MGDAGRLEYVGTVSTKEEAEAALARSSQDGELVNTSLHSGVSCLLGKMNSVSQAIAPAPLFCRAIQMNLAVALNEGSQAYEAPCQLSLQAREELSWWSGQLNMWNGKGLVLK